MLTIRTEVQTLTGLDGLRGLINNSLPVDLRRADWPNGNGHTWWHTIEFQADAEELNILRELFPKKNFRVIR